MTDRHVLRIQIDDELAMAGYYIMAKWPDATNVPVLEFASDALVLEFDLSSGDALAHLWSILAGVSPRSHLLSWSARAWMLELLVLGCGLPLSSGNAMFGKTTTVA